PPDGDALDHLPEALRRGDQLGQLATGGVDGEHRRGQRARAAHAAIGVEHERGIRLEDDRGRREQESGHARGGQRTRKDLEAAAVAPTATLSVYEPRLSVLPVGSARRNSTAFAPA